ncbi:30S ribosomal protein S9, mitochondrial [Vitis riparia]|uniref:30S ribosomal protein S9, mitochondrial n=1 Tax=Vitis riparia TaxID=96939 RepID=UPI00155AF77A|nr:30S ribosomal protein S9, mitochondrial [Vitis riparia]XP_034687896.1 30S ribosomal protein S9, mitochondrial [Vitis riparia]XP_034687897.1 30S ribosomal protein S9, mitochondrial [Vitis riparia]
MLARFVSKPSNFRLLTLLSTKSQSHPPNPKFTLPRFFSTNHNNNDNNTKDRSTFNSWKISQEYDGNGDSIVGQEAGTLAGLTDEGGAAPAEDESWLKDSPWTFEEEGEKGNVLDFGWELQEEVRAVGGETTIEGDGSKELLEKEESALSAVLKGPNRAFGDLIAASGITDAMLDSLIALKDLEGVEGLPPLSEIEDIRYEKNTRKSTRAEIERQKQEEVAKARVRQVDEKGRAYGTGRRKCSIARVWVQPGDGKFMINDKQFDVYFPMLDHRAALLRPFSETKTLGLWDVNCTVKGGGLSGQVGAIRLGISRALQNWEPGLRPQLREAGFLTRDPRVVERKKPGKAKARKSYQWVKR